MALALAWLRGVYVGIKMVMLAWSHLIMYMKGFYKASIMTHHELLPGSQYLSLLVVVLAILLLKPLPYCPVPSNPPLHPNVRLVLAHTSICLDHCAKSHARHLEVPEGTSTAVITRPESLCLSYTHSHLELDGQAPVDRRHGIPNTTEHAGECAPFRSAEHAAPRGLPRRTGDFLVFHGIVRPHYPAKLIAGPSEKMQLNDTPPGRGHATTRFAVKSKEWTMVDSKLSRGVLFKGPSKLED